MFQIESHFTRFILTILYLISSPNPDTTARVELRAYDMASVDEDPAVSRFRKYLRINTISLPSPDAAGQQPDYGETFSF